MARGGERGNTMYVSLSVSLYGLRFVGIVIG